MLTNCAIGENRKTENAMSIYKTKIIPQTQVIFSHLSSGGSLEELAEKLGISITDLKHCIKTHRPLAALVSDAVNISRERDDDAVENALFRRAVGFEQPDGKFAPPDVRAAMFWLKNRRPDEWDEKNRNSSFQNFELSELEEGL